MTESLLPWIGFILGLVVGWTSRAAHDVHAVRKAVVPMPDSPARRKGRWGRADVILAGVQTDRRVDAISRCQQKVTEQLVRAANERTGFAEQAAMSNVKLQQTAQSTVTTILDARGTQAQRRERVRAALKRYNDSLARFEQAHGRATTARQKYPYPTSADIARCR
jgi:hypothetical protein